MSWFRKLFGKSESKLKSASDEQAVRLECEELKRKFEDLRDQMRHGKSGEDARISDAVKMRFESFFSDAATPVAQILALEYLLEAEAKPVQAGDVVAVAKRLIRSLEDAGMRLEGTAGCIAAFDPNLHEPLNGDDAIPLGGPVTVRFVGVSHNGRIIRKAGVERVKEQ